MTIQTQLRRPAISAERRRRRLSSRKGESRQLDLFSGPSPVLHAKTPAWSELPVETRATLTTLIAQLILEYTRAGSVIAVTETGHDL